ncbi:MAG: complex I subunit 5 family protein [Desulfurivibrionaceae bacterium]
MTETGLLSIIYPVILSLVAGLPLLVAVRCCLPAVRKLKAGWNLLPWTTVPALLAGLVIPDDVVVRVPWFFMGGVMGLDGTGRIFLFITAVIWLLAALTVREEFRNRQGERRFSAYFLVAMAGNLGLIVARDMLGFYLFFAIMSFAAYGLINHYHTPESRRAGRIYLILVMVSEVAMFTALVLISFQAQSRSFSDIADISLSLPALLLLFIAFGVKVGALPFQAWMPPAYQQTPIPGATALAGAMANAGILGWLRFIPLGYMVSGSGALLFITAGGLVAIYGVIYGLGQRKAGAVLGSSSMSQMGLMTIVVGLGLLSREGGEYAVYLLPLYAVHHSLAKGSLFLGYGVIERGGRLARPLLLAGLLLASLSLAGLPLTSGAVVKTGLKELAQVSGGSWYALGRVFLPVSSLGTTVLMLHFCRLFWRKRPAGTGQKVLILPWLAALAGSVFCLWMWPVAHRLGRHSLDPSLILHSFWPVAAGTGLFLLWFILPDGFRKRAGDLFPGACPEEELLTARSSAPTPVRCVKVVDQLSTPVKKFLAGAENFYQSLDTSWFGKWLALSPSSPLGARLRKPEKVLGRWSVVGFFYLAVCITLLFLFKL